MLTRSEVQTVSFRDKDIQIIIFAVIFRFLNTINDNLHFRGGPCGACE